MTIRQASLGPKMNLSISPNEIAAAKKVKVEFKSILKELDSALKTIIDLRDAIVNERPSKDDLNKTYRGRLIRYRRKIRDASNAFLSSTKSAFESMLPIADPEMENLREILVAEIDELSSGIEAILDLLGETDRESFTKTLESLSAQIEKRHKSIVDVIDSQLFGHIDKNIFGKMKISTRQFKIRRRARIIKQLLRE